MAQEIVSAPNSGIAPEWERKIDLIKRTVAKGATDDELQLFFHQAKKTGLDPLARQIYCVKRGSGMAIQTGIDGFRLIADRTGRYAGNDDYEFRDDGGKEFPSEAKARIWKIVDGERYPFEATARWSQYYPGDALGFMWRKMPHVMLGKCAEALALRKAFPAELSGVYTREEMEQAGPEIGDQEPPPSPRKETHGKPAAPEAWTCNECRQTNRHAPECSYNKQAEKPKPVETPQGDKLTAMVSSFEAKETAGGKRPYVAISAVDQQRKAHALYLYHKSLFDFVPDWKGQVCIFEVKTSAKGHTSIDKVLKAGTVTYSENRPVGRPVTADGVLVQDEDVAF